MLQVRIWGTVLRIRWEFPPCPRATATYFRLDLSRINLCDMILEVECLALNLIPESTTLGSNFSCPTPLAPSRFPHSVCPIPRGWECPNFVSLGRGVGCPFWLAPRAAQAGGPCRSRAWAWLLWLGTVDPFFLLAPVSEIDWDFGLIRRHKFECFKRIF